MPISLGRVLWRQWVERLHSLVLEMERASLSDHRSAVWIAACWIFSTTSLPQIPGSVRQAGRSLRHFAPVTGYFQNLLVAWRRSRVRHSLGETASLLSVTISWSARPRDPHMP